MLWWYKIVYIARALFVACGIEQQGQMKGLTHDAQDFID